MRILTIFAVLAFTSPLSAKAPAVDAVPIGAPVNCVNIRNIQSTKVVDDHTIDFVMNGRQVMRNNLPQKCPQLGFERAFGYQTSIGQLCSVDIITVIVQGAGGMRGASCGLGKFTPIAPPARK